MRIYVQSKTGNYNTEFNCAKELGKLYYVLTWMRQTGSYIMNYRGREICVPFEEVEYIAEVKP